MVSRLSLNAPTSTDAKTKKKKEKTLGGGHAGPYRLRHQHSYAKTSLVAIAVGKTVAIS